MIQNKKNKNIKKNNMICDILFPITPGKISMNTTASSNNSSDSSFEKPKVPSLIPRLQLS